MTNPFDAGKSRVLTLRRVTLLASVAAVGAALLLAGPNGYLPSFGMPSAAAAELSGVGFEGRLFGRREWADVHAVGDGGSFGKSGFQGGGVGALAGPDVAQQ